LERLGRQPTSGPSRLQSDPEREIVGPAAVQPTATLDAIEPITIKRRGVGFRGMDRARAYPGFTLFAPIAASNRTVYLIDMEGKVIHRWEMLYAPGLR
jgi:hypothetical protein